MDNFMPHSFFLVTTTCTVMRKKPGYEPWTTIENLMPGTKKGYFHARHEKTGGFHTRHEKRRFSCAARKRAVFMPVFSMDAYASVN